MGADPAAGAWFPSWPVRSGQQGQDSPSHGMAGRAAPPGLLQRAVGSEPLRAEVPATGSRCSERTGAVIAEGSQGLRGEGEGSGACEEAAAGGDDSVWVCFDGVSMLFSFPGARSDAGVIRAI